MNAGTDPDDGVEQMTSHLVLDDALLDVLEESRRLGFLGPGPVTGHIRHATTFLAQMSEPGRVLDLGSGGGVPGLVLAVALRSTSFVLLDAMQRRCRFLDDAVTALGLSSRVSVRCGRAEELAHDPALRAQFDVVVVRSFGPAAVAAECAVGFVAPSTGRVLVSEPPSSDPGRASRWPTGGLGTLALELGDRWSTSHGTVQVLRSTGVVDERFPRRTGVPAKRPLF